MIKLPKPTWLGDIYGHSDATLKQAVRDFGEQVLNCYSPDDSAQDWADKIRALIKEIE